MTARVQFRCDRHASLATMQQYESAAAASRAWERPSVAKRHGFKRLVRRVRANAISVRRRLPVLERAHPWMLALYLLCAVAVCCIGFICPWGFA